MNGEDRLALAIPETQEGPHRRKPAFYPDRARLELTALIQLPAWTHAAPKRRVRVHGG